MIIILIIRMKQKAAMCKRSGFDLNFTKVCYDGALFVNLRGCILKYMKTI